MRVDGVLLFCTVWEFEPSAMMANRPIAIAVVTLVLMTGLAAVGAAQPPAVANATADNATDGGPGVDVPENASQNASETADAGGPSEAMPDHAHDRVHAIHERVDGFLDGSIDHLGNALAELLGNADDD